MSEKLYLKKLNKEQYEAATIIDGFELINAGAGTGKTHVLISRVAYLLDSGIAPENILLLTFTKKAANEMKDRISKFIGEEKGQKITAQTFHSFCVDQLRKYGKVVGLNNDFEIIDDKDSEDYMAMFSKPIKEEYKKNQKEIKYFPKNDVLVAIYSKVVATLTSPYEIISQDPQLYVDKNFRKDAIDIIKTYNTHKREHNLLDYDDMLYFMYKLLSKHEKIRSKLDRKFTHIMCDEYQDTNIIQDKLLDLLSIDCPNLCVVGDPFQSIYSWRSANIENILDFDKRHPDTKVVKLFRNYRSSQQILDHANAVISHSKDGTLNPLLGNFQGNKPEYRVYNDDKQLAADIAQEIKQKLQEGILPKELCIMGRVGASTDYVEAQLSILGIPFAKFGGKGFFANKVIREVLAYVKASQSFDDELSWMKILTLLPGVANKKAQKIYSMLFNERSLDSLMKVDTTFVSNLAPIERLYDLMKSIENRLPQQQLMLVEQYYLELKERIIKDMKTSDDKIDEELKKFHKNKSKIKVLQDMSSAYVSTREMLEDFALNVPGEDDQKKDDCVNVTTVHSSKGLEYEYVYLINPIMSVFPKTEDDTLENREDMRCMYVAITRPKKGLFICLCKEVLLNGVYRDGILSSFLSHDNVLKVSTYPSELLDMLANID